MKFASKFLLAKIQPDPNVDPTPDGTNAIETSDLSITPYQGNTVSTNVDRLTLGASKQINTSPQNELSFNVQFAGSGGATPDVPAGYGPLLRACGLSETIDSTAGSEKVTYAPISTGFEELALYFLRVVSDTVQLRHPTLNVKGNLQINATSEQLPQFQFDNFLGLYVRPTRQTALITPDTTTFKDSIPFTKGNTPTLTIDGYQGCVNSWTFNLGNTISRADEPGCTNTLIEDREPTGTIVLKATDPDTKDFYQMIESHVNVSTVAIALQHGDTANQILEVNLPQIQPTGISEQEVRGELYYEISYTALPTDAGDDEFELITR